MPIDLLFHDDRLEGLTPASTSGRLAFTVGDGTPLSEFFQICQTKARTFGGIGELSILCHGLEAAGHVPGFGLLFCSECVTSNTIGDPPDASGAGGTGFGLLRGLVRKIVLYACGPAAHAGFALITEEYGTIDGSGYDLCRQMAINAGAFVVAPSEAQAYDAAELVYQHVGSPDDPLIYCIVDEREEPMVTEFGGWEGRVYTFDPNGNVVEEAVFPSAWRDASGDLHDPRELTVSTAPGDVVEESWFCRD